MLLVEPQPLHASSGLSSDGKEQRAVGYFTADRSHYASHRCGRLSGIALYTLNPARDFCEMLLHLVQFRLKWLIRIIEPCEQRGDVVLGPTLNLFHPDLGVAAGMP